MIVARGSVLVAVALLVLTSAPAWAHKPSDAYLALAVDGTRVQVHWDIALRDLALVVEIDADGNGDLTGGEVRAAAGAIAAYAGARLAVAADGAPCRLGPLVLDGVIDHSDGTYGVLLGSASCPAAPHRLAVDYRLLFDLDASHLGLIHVRDEAGGVYTRVAGLDAPRVEVVLDGAGTWASFAAFLVEGVRHIWLGFDHVLFLLALLVPAVLRRSGRSWRPAEGLAPVVTDVFRVVTAFTVAHSITLAASTLGLVRLPVRLAETAIALSVLLAAINNLVPIVGDNRWSVAFALGLLHGFGFSSVLIDLGLPRGALAAALVGFNTGVELGQAAIVLAFLPLAYWARGTRGYAAARIAGSLALAALAAVWAVQRWTA